MSKVLVEESSLSGIAGAIRQKNGTNNVYKPSQMAAAIQALPGASTLGTKNIVTNRSYAASGDNLDGYSSVSVDVPNSYAAADEGKVVSNGALVAQTARSAAITQNGTYDTTLNNSVTVNVSSSGYNQVGLLLHYDGIDNTGSGHDASSTTWKDLSGNGNDGTVHNGAWENDALIFNGTTFVDGNQYLWFGAFTMEFLMTKPAPNSVQQFYTKRATDNGLQIITLANGQYEILINSSKYFAQPTVAAEELFLLTFTYDMQTMKLYENGILNSTFTSGAIGAINGAVFNIGRYSRDNSAAADYYTGKMKHVGIYSRALSAEEVTANYQYLAQRFTLS